MLFEGSRRCRSSSSASWTSSSRSSTPTAGRSSSRTPRPTTSCRSSSGAGAAGRPTRRGVKASVSTGLIREAIDAGEAVLTRDAQQDDRFAANQSIYLYGIRSAMTVPLTSREKVLGVVHLDKRDSRRPFDEEDLHVLVIVCTQAASALANAELIEQITMANRNLEVAKVEIERWNRELEKKVEERTLEIQRQNEKISELARQKDELLGMVAHDLRTPLTGLLGFSEIAIQGLHTHAPIERVKEDIEVIRATAMEMNDLLSDLLDVSKIEAGKIAIQPYPTDIREIVEESRKPLRPLGGLEADRVPRPVRGDAAQGPARPAADPAGAQQPRLERDQVQHVGRRGHARESTGRRKASRSRSATRARGSPPTTSSGCSRGSSRAARRRRAASGAPASGSRSRRRSSSSTAGGSGSSRRRASARGSPSCCRCGEPRLHFGCGGCGGCGGLPDLASCARRRWAMFSGLFKISRTSLVTFSRGSV